MTIYQNQNVIQSVVDYLRSCPQIDIACSVGFDGYVDELYHVVKTRKSQDELRFYNSIESFGKRILQASQKSADLELVLSQRKIGGNGPILSNALALLGSKVTCIGTLDLEGGDNPFQEMPRSCRQISFGSASHTIALEFDDGKVMLGNLRGNYFTWEQMKEKVGLSNLQESYRTSKLIAIVNWSGLHYIQEILEGYQREVCGHFSPDCRKDKIFFFDLADPTVLCDGRVHQFLQCIRSYSQNARVILGLNENEAGQIGEICCPDCSGLAEIGEELRKRLGLFQVIIHTNEEAFCFSEEKSECFQGMYVEHPVISTGAGDHFNAGYLWAVLNGLSIEQSLVLGQAEASFYLSAGRAPTTDQLSLFLEDQLPREKGVVNI